MKRGTLTVIASCAVIALVALGVMLPSGPAAHADTVTVPYVDRLGCGGSSDAVVTPIFSYNGSGTAANGAGYSATTSASAYPATTGGFSAVAPGTGYTVYVPDGYGSSTVYRGALALGWPNVTAARAATLTITLPHPQAIQMTVGGIDVPSRLTVSGSGPGGVVSASSAVRSTAPGSATVTGAGTALRVNGATTGGADAQPSKAVDVWFAQPVTSLTLSLSGAGGSTDGGFLVTPPIACQSGSVSTTGTVGSPIPDAAAGRVAYPVDLTTTVTNASPSSGAFLHPSVTAPLTTALTAQGMTLDSITPGAASDSACAAVAGVNGSGPLIAPGAASLAPGATCTLAWSATVSMPQSTADRSVSITSTLASSATSDARVKSTAPTTLTFPGVSSTLSISESGATQAQPGSTVSHTTTVTNGGPGSALATVLSVDTGRLTPSGYPAACTFTSPTLTCDLGTIVVSGSAVVSYSVAVPGSAADGTGFTLAVSAASTAQSAPATSSATITVFVTPPPTPPPSPPPAPRPQPVRPVPVAPAPPPAAPVTPVVPAPQPVTPAPAPSPVPASALPMNLSFAGSRMTPGTASSMRGTIGPNGAAGPVVITLTGRVTQGTTYRAVSALIDGTNAGDCTVQAREFSCVITLAPGQSASLEIRLFADALNAPATAVQQLAVASSDPDQNNAKTITTAVNQQRDTDVWASAFVLNFNSLPAAFLPLLALFLYALAASVARTTRSRNDTDRSTPSDGGSQ